MSDFKSVVMGGFKCANHINRSGLRADMLHETGHVKHVREDYRNLFEMGILTVREGICWSRVEYEPYNFNFTSLL